MPGELPADDGLDAGCLVDRDATDINVVDKVPEPLESGVFGQAEGGRNDFEGDLSVGDA